MFLVSSFSCLCPIQWNQLLIPEWRCSRSTFGTKKENSIQVSVYLGLIFYLFKICKSIIDFIVWTIVHSLIVVYVHIISSLVIYSSFIARIIWPFNIDANTGTVSLMVFMRLNHWSWVTPSHHLNQRWLIINWIIRDKTSQKNRQNATTYSF